MKRIAIFASGSGSNALNLIRYFQHSEVAAISGIYTNKKDSGVSEYAREYHIPLTVFDRTALYDTDTVLQALHTQQTDLIVLAGFLWLVPPKLITAYQDKIINIHPSLLPKYGGKGMYGNHVHQAVLAHKENESGITIHLVNEEFDKGRILAQYAIPVGKDDTVDSLRLKIRQLEHRYLPEVVATYCGQL